MPPVEPWFWHQPIRYLRWASRERPALFWSVFIGGLSPFFLFGAPPIRARVFNDHRPPSFPRTYPIPAGPRRIPEGYDD